MVEIHDAREATIVVAASNSLTVSADYTCDGTADNVQIQAAIDALPAAGGTVLLLEGVYDIDAPITLTDYDRLRGVGMFTTILDSDLADVVVEDCEDAWNDETGGSVTCTADAVDFKVGSNSAKFVVAGGVGATTLLATEVITSADYSSYHRIAFWLKTTVALSDGDLELYLDDSPNCGSPIKTLDIPATDADVWTYHELDLGDASGLTAVISVGLYQTADIGAAAGVTLNIDDINVRNYVIMVEKAGTYASNVEVSDLKITGSGGGLLIHGVKYSTFRNIYCDTLTGSGICLHGENVNADAVWYNTFVNCFLNNCHIGIYLGGISGWVNSIHFIGGQMLSNTWAGVYTLIGNGNSFFGCTVEGNTEREIFNVSAWTDFYGCRIEGGGSDIYNGVSGWLGIYGGRRTAAVFVGNIGQIVEIGFETPTKLLLDSTPGYDHRYSGLYSQFTAGENLVFRDCCYLKAADSKMWKTDANAAATAVGIIAMCVETIAANAEGTFLMIGWLRDDTDGWTKAAPIYLSAAAAGDVTQTAPAGAGDQIRKVGFAGDDADNMFFDPDSTVLEVA